MSLFMIYLFMFHFFGDLTINIDVTASKFSLYHLEVITSIDCRTNVFS